MIAQLASPQTRNNIFWIVATCLKRETRCQMFPVRADDLKHFFLKDSADVLISFSSSRSSLYEWKFKTS